MSEGLPPLREFLLREVLRFVRTASTIPGVTRIALVGSLATMKPNPKDADVLVSIADDGSDGYGRSRPPSPYRSASAVTAATSATLTFSMRE